MSYSAIAAVANLQSPAPSLLTAQFDPYVLLQIFYFVPGLSVSGTPRMRFNNDSGTTAYAYNVTDGSLVATVVTLVGATGIAAAASGILLSAIAATMAVGGELIVGNGNGQAHSIMMRGIAGVVDASAAPHTISGAGVWSTTQQIQSVQLDAGPNGGNLNAGAGLLVIGINP